VERQRGPPPSRAPSSKLQAPSSKSRRASPAPCWQSTWCVIAASFRRPGRCGSSADAEDIASEVVMRAWSRFGQEPACWEHARRWCFVTARHLWIDRLRRLRLALIEDQVILENLVAPVDAAVLPEPPPSSTPPWVGELSAALSKPDRATLALMAEGVIAKAAIAAARGRTIRAVEMSLVRIRSAAATLLRHPGSENRPERFVPDRGIT
jgi:DNA-directed RNA polymerase specialized sigma24 family protein